MKIFLAGHESQIKLKGAISYLHPYSLFSYHYVKDMNADNRAFAMEHFNRSGAEILCDSGLFTFMFGAGKGQAFPLSWWKEYAHQYIETAKSWGLKNITIVECDAHKLLGMDATWELREIFAKAGLPVLYVWHKEEGIDGLIDLCNRVDYIALSVPELRILFKGDEVRYQEAIFDLLGKIKTRAKKIPKIHLLGNTVDETMRTTLAYSCDSTSWIAGIRFGSYRLFNGRKMYPVERQSKAYLQELRELETENSAMMQILWSDIAKEGKVAGHVLDSIVAAKAYARYQNFLDSQYTWVGAKKT